nr:circularly permuted type 2 ATP-grasp protein [Gordonia amarae]
MPAVFDRYRADAGSGSYDEMLDGAGEARAGWSELVAGYGIRGPRRLGEAAHRLAGAVRDEGIVYNEYDGDATITRDWVVDAAPLMVDGTEWASLEKAIAQRSTLLDLLLRDIYHDQKLISAGIVPPEMIYGHPGYLRKAAHLDVAAPHALFLHAVDLGRRADGTHVVYADRTQAPSGIGYALADRRILSRTFAQLFQDCAPRPISTFVQTLRLALLDYAPPGVEDPTVAVLSPGSMSETAFDQAYLASALGIPLVEGPDLTVRDGAVYMRSLGKYRRVDVLLRRVDAEFVDPLDLRTDSQLGVAGLVEAISRGNVTVVNTLGSGVLENPALHTVLDAVARELLGEPLLLESVPTFWAGDPGGLSKILAEAESMVLTNVRTGEEIVGALSGSAALSGLRARIEAQNWQWVGRSLVQYSTAPTMLPGAADQPSSREVRGAPVSLRAFSLARGQSYAVMPGALGSVLVDGAAGRAMATIGAKDVWLTSAGSGGHVSRKTQSRTEPAEIVDAAAAPVRSGATASRDHVGVSLVASPRVLSDLFWVGRYLERVDGTTRLAKVCQSRYEELQRRSWAGLPKVVPVLLHATGWMTGTAGYLGTAALLETESGDEPADILTLIAKLTADRHVPGTIAYSRMRLVGAVRAVRDQMTTSTWMVLAPAERAISRLTRMLNTDVDPDTPQLELGPELASVHDDILFAVLALSGLQAESMVQDPGWYLLDVGRRAERAIALADLTAALFTDVREPDLEQPLLESFLVANESSVTYRRRNRGLIRLGAVLELMLFDESNPRSMVYQLTTMMRDLTALPDSVRSAGAERIVEDLTAELRRADPADLTAADAEGRRADLGELMTTLRGGIREVSDLLARTRFAQPRALRPLWAGQGADIDLTGGSGG